MNCTPEWMLSAHLDGDLQTDEAQRVEAHLADCDSCRVVHQQLSTLRADLSSLADVEPTHDLWPEISIRHNSEERRPWLRWIWPALAATAAAAMLIFVVLPREGPETTPAKIVQAYASVVAAEHTYTDSITALENAVGDRTVATLSPKARTAIEQGLAQIDETILLCRTELEGAPHDIGAHRALLAAYQRKVDLLTELVDRSM